MSFLDMTFNPRERITRESIAMQKSHPFFSYILMQFKVTAAVDNKSIPTAAVNQYGNFFYNEGFIEKLTREQLQGLLAHEVLHIAKGDFFRRGKREPSIWNIASDAVINYILVNEGFQLPEGGINPERDGSLMICGVKFNVADRTTEDVYEEMLTKLPIKKVNIFIKGGGKGKPGEKGGSGKGDPSDEKSEDGQGNGHGGFDIHLEHDSDGQGGETGEESGQGGRDAAENAAKRKWERATVEAATNARARGTLPGFAESIVDKLLNPVVDWRQRIQRFITNEIPVDYTNRRPGRSFYATGAWAPMIHRENVDVFVSVDVSGSTAGDREYFFSELFGILNSFHQIRARVIFWDAIVNPENDHLITASNKDMITQLPIKDCNGGTRMSSYADYCKEKGYRSQVHIIMTDGFIESDPIVPSGHIMFVLTKDGSDEYLKKLGAVCRLTDVAAE